MKLHKPTIVSGNNLSIAWAQAFLRTIESKDPGCLIISIRDFREDIPSQDKEIYESLDQFLRSANPYIPTINQTALTIFPYQRWIRLGRPAPSEIRHWYLHEYLPRLKARCTKNRRGTYFERLINFSGVKRENGTAQIRDVDQLGFVIDLWRKGQKTGKRPRQSALQLSIFDPAKDHTGSALAGFPCLQQISLTYKEEGTLELNAYYPTQFMLDRAYGNYLGLCQLGHFIAHNLGIRLVGFTCFVAHPEIGSVSRRDASSLARVVRQRLNEIIPVAEDEEVLTAHTGH